MGDSQSVPRDVLQTISDSQLKILAQLKLTGIKNEDAAKQLGLTVYQIRKMEEKEEFKDLIRELSEQMVKEAVNTWKGSVSKLIPKALAALEKNLDLGKIEAVKVVMSSIGLDKVENQNSGGTLQVILPDYTKVEKKVDVEIS